MVYIFNFVLGLITPFFSLFFLPLYKNQKLQAAAIAAFISTIFIFFEPLDGFDLLVHYNNFTAYQAGQYELFSRYIGVDLLIYGISLLGLSGNFLVVITSFILFYSTFRFVEQKVPSNRIVLVFILVVVSYPLVLLISGVRFSLALSFFLLADISFTQKKYFNYLLYALMAIVFHYAISVLFAIYIASKFLRVNRIRIHFIVSAIILLLPLIFYQTFLIQFVSLIMRTVGFEQYVGLDLSRYVSGEWGAMRSASYNLNGLLGYFLPKVFLCLMGFVYLLVCKERDSFIITLFIIVIMLFNFGDIGDRYAICLIPFVITSLMNTGQKISLKKFPFPLLFILCFVALNCFKEILLYRDVYANMIVNTFLFNSPLFALIGGN